MTNGVTWVTGTAVDHTCDTSHTPILDSGSDTVFSDGLETAYKGSVFNCGDKVDSGSDTVFIDGKNAARIGDITEGHGCFPPTVIETGSSVVFIGD